MTDGCRSREVMARKRRSGPGGQVRLRSGHERGGHVRTGWVQGVRSREGRGSGSGLPDSLAPQDDGSPRSEFDPSPVW